MRIIGHLAGASILALAFAAPAENGASRNASAGAVPALGVCPHARAGYADGCADSPAGGTFINRDFYTTSLLSGQGPISTPPPWDVAGVDYHIGPLTDDAHKIDAKISPPAGCTYGPSDRALLYIRCPGTGNTVDISGFKLIGVGIWMTGTDQILKGRDWHLQMTAESCRRFSGVAPIRGGSAYVELTSGAADWDDYCANNADQYKMGGDPGFKDQSNGTATIIGNSLNYVSAPSGNVAVGSYIAVNGALVMRARIISGAGLNWQLETPANGSFNGVTISGNTMTYTTKSGSPAIGDKISGTGIAAGTRLVADLGSNRWQVSISQTVSSAVSATVWKQFDVSTPSTVTTGPIETNAAAVVAGHSGGAKYRYNVFPHWGTAFGNTGGSDIDIRYNYWTTVGRGSHPHTNDGQHNQFMAWIPSPGSTTLGIKSIQDFNTVVVEPYGDDGTYTGIFSQFSTCSSCSPSANSPSGYKIQFDLVSMSWNTVIGNASKNAPGKVMAAGVFRTLSQGPNTAVAVVNWSMKAGNVTINSLISGAMPSVGDTILCNSFPGCSQAVKLLSQTDATHFTALNTVDAKSNIQNTVAKWPGEFNTYRSQENYVVPTSVSGVHFDDLAGIAVLHRIVTGNVNMLTGGTAN